MSTKGPNGGLVFKAHEWLIANVGPKFFPNTDYDSVTTFNVTTSERIDNEARLHRMSADDGEVYERIWFVQAHGWHSQEILVVSTEGYRRRLSVSIENDTVAVAFKLASPWITTN